MNESLKRKVPDIGKGASVTRVRDYNIIDVAFSEKEVPFFIIPRKGTPPLSRQKGVMLVNPPLKMIAEQPVLSSSPETNLQSSMVNPFLNPSLRLSLTSTGKSVPTSTLIFRNTSIGNLALLAIEPP